VGSPLWIDTRRQVAVLFVVAVKEAALLLAVQRVVRGVQIQHDPLGRPSVCLEKELHEQRFDLCLVGDDLLIACLAVRIRQRQLQPVERALAGQRLAAIFRRAAILPRQIPFADQGRQERVVTQLVMIVQILVAQCHAVDSLRYEFLGCMLNQPRRTMVCKAGGELPQDARSFFYFSQ